jgi:hypothetical protein
MGKRTVAIGTTGLLLVLGLGACSQGDDQPDVAVRAEDAPTATAPPRATDDAATTTVPPTTTTTTQRPTTTTQPRATTTTTAPAATETFTVAPITGAANSEVVASGTGCAGDGYGASLEIRDASGQGITGDGGASQADGTWRVPMRFPNVAPGRYTIRASCVNGATVVFEYPARFFTVTA